MQLLFIVLQSIMVFLFLIQDTINLAPFNNLRAQIKFLGWTKTLVGTAIMTGLAVASLVVAIKFNGAPLPLGAKIFYVFWWSMLMLGMYASWYKPYLFGPTPKEMDMYNQLFAGTHSVLPIRRGFPGPNTFHLFMHFFMIACAILGFAKVAGVF